MPKLDGTGPRGQGSRTGRGLGNCSVQIDQNTDKEERKRILEEEKKRIEEELKKL